MSADKSFLIRIDKTRKSDAFDKLGNFCLNANKTFLNKTSFINGLDISIVLKRHPDFKNYVSFSDYNLSIASKYAFGTVVLRFREQEKYVSLDFWPITSPLFNTLNTSSELKRRYIDLIKFTNGYDFRIDNGDATFQMVFNNRNMKDNFT